MSLPCSVPMLLVVALAWMQLAVLVGAADTTSSNVHDDNNPCPALMGTLSPPSRYDPLACWLWKLHLVIPDQSFHKSFLSLGIEDMTCTNFTVSSIASSYLPSNDTSSDSNDVNPSLDIQVHGIAATCQGRYRATPGLSGTVQVHVDSDTALREPAPDKEENHHDRRIVTSPPTPPLHLVWSLLSNSTSDTMFDWPTSLNTTTCDTHLLVPSHGGIHFYGSISAQMINWFSGSIASYVSDALSTQLCPLVIANVDPALSHLLQQAQTYLQHVIQEDGTTPNNSNNSTNNNNLYNHTSKSEMAQFLQPTKQGQQQQQQQVLDRTMPISRKTAHHSNATNTTSLAWLNFTTDTPVLTSALTLLNDVVLKRYLHEGFLLQWWNQQQQRQQQRHSPCPDDSSCGWLFGGVNSMIHSLISWLAPKEAHINDNDSLCIRFSPGDHRFSTLHNITFLLPHYGRVILDVKRFCIQGLDQMESVQLFRPMVTPDDDHYYGNTTTTHAKRSKPKPKTATATKTTSFDTNLMTRRGWNVTTQLHVTVQSIPGGIVQGPDLEEEFQWHVNISRGEIGTSSSSSSSSSRLPHNHTSTNGAGVMVRIRRDLFRQVITVGLLEDALGSLLDAVLGNDEHLDHDKQVLPCFLAPFESIHLPSLLANLTLGSISLVPVDDYETTTSRQQLRQTQQLLPQEHPAANRWMGGESLEEDVDELLNHVLELFLNEYAETFTAALAGLTAGPLRVAINHWLEKSLRHWKKPTATTGYPLASSATADEVLAVCNRTLPNSSAASNTFLSTEGKVSSSSSLKHVVNWTHVHLLKSFNRWLQRNQTIEGINEYMNCVSSFINDNLLTVINIGLGKSLALLDPAAFLSSESLVLRVRNARIVHAGKLDHVEIMSPVSNLAGLLESRLDYATCSNDSVRLDETVPQISAELELFYPALANLSATVNLTVYLGDVHLNGSVSVLYDHDMLRGMMLSDVLLKGHCALSVPTSEFQIPETMARIGVLGLNVSALVTTTNTPANDPVLVHLHYQDKPSATISSVVNWALLSIRDWVNESSDTVLSASQKVCNSTQEAVPVPSDDDINHDASRWIFLGVGALFVLLQPAILMLVKYRRSGPAQSDSRDRELVEPLLSSLEDSGGTKMHALEESVEIEHSVPSSLMMSRAVPDTMRVLLPMFIIGTVATLVSSNLSVGASVDLHLSLSGQTTREVKLPSLFAFSLGNTLLQMYQAGIYPLLFLVLVFSGVWPYLKLLLMLLAWLVPISQNSLFQRKQLLLALDALGKFSLVDTYVLVLMMVAFRYHLPLTENMAVDVFVAPSYGFYGFLIATCASLVAGHTMIFFHRQGELNTQSSEISSAVGERYQAVMQHEYYVHDTADDGTRVIRRKRLRLWVRLLFIALVITTIVFLAIGVTRKSFVFEFGGLAGMALSEGKRRMSYSLVSLGAALPSSVPTDYGAGIRWLQVAYYFYALVTPFACLCLVTVLWIFPLSLRYQNRVVMLAEIANAWSAIEVFVLSMVAALLEISTFCSFIIGHKCDLINEFVSNYLDKALPNPGDHTCYSVQASVEWDCWYLIAGAVLNSFLVSSILRFAHGALDDRRLQAEEAAEGPQHDGGANAAVVRHAENVHDDETMIGCLSRCPLSHWLFSTCSDANNAPATAQEPTETPVPDGEAQQRYWDRWREVCSVT